MCVIMVCEDKRPAPIDIDKAFRCNPDGAGIAYRRDGKVYWKKGLEIEEVQHLCKIAPLPFVVHFRVASVGPAQGSLTHPFEINQFATEATEGVTDGWVLFHNGTWSSWKHHVLGICVSKGIEIPAGKFSDTRAMAYLCGFYGRNFMEMIDEKGVAFGPGDEDCDIFKPNDWYEHAGMWVSNTIFTRHSGSSGQTGAWERTGYSGTYKMCRHPQCSNEALLDTDGYCPRHPQGRSLPALAPITSQAQSQQQPKATGGENPLATTFTDVDDVTNVSDSSDEYAEVEVQTVKDSHPFSSAEFGGAQHLFNPFARLQEAEALHKRKKMSKQELKRIRKAFETLFVRRNNTYPQGAMNLVSAQH